MDIVQVKDEFSWKSLGAKSDRYLKCALSKEEWVLQKMKFGILKTYYNSISNFFLAVEFKKISFLIRESKTSTGIIHKPKLQKQKTHNYLDAEYFQQWGAWLTWLFNCTISLPLKSVKSGNESVYRCLWLEKYHFLVRRTSGYHSNFHMAKLSTNYFCGDKNLVSGCVFSACSQEV